MQRRGDLKAVLLWAGIPRVLCRTPVWGMLTQLIMRKDRVNEEGQGERGMTRLSLSISSQALLSDRTGHGQLRHVSEQRMHYLQVGDCILFKIWVSEIHERAALININCSLITDCVSNERDKDRKYSRCGTLVGHPHHRAWHDTIWMWSRSSSSE